MCVANRTFAKRDEDSELAVSGFSLDTQPFIPLRAASRGAEDDDRRQRRSRARGRAVLGAPSRRRCPARRRARPARRGGDAEGQTRLGRRRRAVQGGGRGYQQQGPVRGPDEAHGAAHADQHRGEERRGLARHRREAREGSQHPEALRRRRERRRRVPGVLPAVHRDAEGNLCWLAAFEAEPRRTMALRAIPRTESPRKSRRRACAIRTPKRSARTSTRTPRASRKPSSTSGAPSGSARSTSPARSPRRG